MSFRRSLVCAVACVMSVLGLQRPSYAQLGCTSDKLEGVREEQQAGLNTVRNVVTAPDATSPYALPAPQVILQTTNSGSEATAVIGISNPCWGFRTTFKSPIGKEPDAEAAPLSLTGLANQATVDFAFIKPRIFKHFEGMDDYMLAFCASHGIPHDKCSDQAFKDPADRKRFLAFSIQEHPSIVTAHLQIGGKSFDFVPKGSLQRQTETHTSVAAGASYSLLFLESSSVLAFYADGARDYNASRDSTSLCQPIDTGVTGTQRCDTRTIGSPTARTKGTATVDWRHVWLQASQPVVGLSLQFHAQVLKGGETIWSVEAPVYFLQKKAEENKSLALNGGVNAGWTSKDGFVVRVFIGSAFKLLGKDIVQQ